MANPTIQFDNTTVSAITLGQLGIVVPGSGSYMATDDVLVSDIINDPELNTFVDGGDITLTVDAVALTEEQSKAYVGYDRYLDNNSATTCGRYEQRRGLGAFRGDVRFTRHDWNDKPRRHERHGSPVEPCSRPRRPAWGISSRGCDDFCGRVHVRSGQNQTRLPERDGGRY
jgi:hypothetical protein